MKSMSIKLQERLHCSLFHLLGTLYPKQGKPVLLTWKRPMDFLGLVGTRIAHRNYTHSSSLRVFYHSVTDQCLSHLVFPLTRLFIEVLSVVLFVWTITRKGRLLAAGTLPYPTTVGFSVSSDHRNVASRWPSLGVHANAVQQYVYRGERLVYLSHHFLLLFLLVVHPKPRRVPQHDIQNLLTGKQLLAAVASSLSASC